MHEKQDTLKFENELFTCGYRLIAGVDEAGRGPLAGPVVAACVLLPLDDPIEGINDSKKLSPKKRAELLKIIRDKAIAYGVGIVDHETIDAINILNATKLAMKQAVESMTIQPDFVLVDAVKDLDITQPQMGIIKGDALSYMIAAASIIAKETRDDLMRDYAKAYPVYGMERHKGYPTKAHREAILEFGPCPIHRQSFLKKLLGEA